MNRNSIRGSQGKVGQKAIANGFVMLFAFVSVISAQDFSAWPHHKDIYFDTSPKGAAVDGDVYGFPVVVKLTAADFPFSEARGNGQDLRFSKPDGTAVPFEIDTYDSTAGEAAVWVLADTVKGASKGALLRLYWGNASAGAAADSGKVFTAANGFTAVWHLGGRYPTARKNSVAAGMDAVAGNYDGDEQTRGIVGYADSLDGGSPGDHLQTWQTFDSLSKEFTFSIWAYPTGVAVWQRFMDFGNGTAQDNLVLGRANGSDSLRFENFNGSSGSSIGAPGAITLNEWQYFTATVSGKTASIYRNGILLVTGQFTDTIRAVRRGSNYLGRGNWSDVAYYQGKLDEPEVSAAARGPDWIKLAYANQKPNQSLLSFVAPVICAPHFSVPGDTAVPEGSALNLAGVADCADQFVWSVLDGFPLRLLDPEVKALDLAIPRVTADTSVALRFTATYGATVKTQDVRVTIKNTLPDPRFTLPASLVWSGRDTLPIRPTLTNLAALKVQGLSDLRAAWSLAGPAVDTLLQPDGLSLLPTLEEGNLEVTLCLDNGGLPYCRTSAVAVGAATGVGPAASAVKPGGMPSGFEADGRLRGADGAFRRLFARPPRASR